MIRNIRDQLSSFLLPSAQELWDRADAQMETVPGTENPVPFFDDEIDNVQLLDEADLKVREGKRMRRFGHEAMYAFHVGDVDYLASVSRSEDDDGRGFTISRSMAYTTTLGGYTSSTDRQMVRQTKGASIAVGPPHSTNELPKWKELSRVPETFRESLDMSLARSTQAEMKITRYLVDEFGLSDTLSSVGDSRGSIVGPAKYPYAEHEGLHMLDFDTFARCSLERYTLEHTGKFAKWLRDTVLGGIAASAALAQTGELGTLKGSTSLNPNFLVSRFTGDFRALASDEPLRILEWLPKNARGIETIYGLDTLCDEDLMRLVLGGHDNVRIKPVPNGNHGAVIHPEAKEVAINRMVRRASEYRRNGGDAKAMNWPYVYGDVEHPWQTVADNVVQLHHHQDTA